MTEEKQPEVEIYSLEWCPYCNKAKNFLKSKGFSFQEYDIGKSEEKKREMLARTDGARTVPQIFIDDELIGGYDDLIDSKKSGELNELLDLDENDYYQRKWDSIVIGAGPGGLNAALYGARKGLDILIISEALGGQMADTGEVGNYLGKSGAKGPELLQDFWNHVQEFLVDIELGVRVVEIEENNSEGLLVRTDSGKEVGTRTVIIATGTTNRQLGIPGEKELKGRGVHYCATCDGYLYSGKKVAVVGGGNAGLEAALDLAKLDCEVVLIEVEEQLTGDRILQEQIEDFAAIDIISGYSTVEIKGDIEQGQVEQLVIEKVTGDETKELSVEAVFVEIGLLPNSEFVADLVDLNDTGEIIIDEDNQTGVERIWAAGDVTNIQDKQIIISAAEGAKTALRVNEFLS